MVGTILVLGVLALTAPDTQAQLITSNNGKSEEFQDVFVGNSCTGDGVFATGHSQTVTQTNQNRLNFQNHQNGKGVGVPSGAQYQYENMTSNEFRFTPPPTSMTFTIRKHLIRVGSPNTPSDDLFFRETMTCTGAACRTTDVRSDGCR